MRKMPDAGDGAPVRTVNRKNRPIPSHMKVTALYDSRFSITERGTFSPLTDFLPIRYGRMLVLPI